LQRCKSERRQVLAQNNISIKILKASSEAFIMIEHIFLKGFKLRRGTFEEFMVSKLIEGVYVSFQ